MSGQDRGLHDTGIDCYFTSWPENTTVLLTRRANGMPVMIKYDYGNGTVIATTAYEDWGFTHGQSSRDGRALVRDILAWAKEPNKPIPEFAPGGSISIPINVSNKAQLPAEKVVFSIIDPDKNILGTVNVTETIGVEETKTINFTFTAPSKLGIYWIDYSLINASGDYIQTTYEAERFAVSLYEANPDGFVYQGSDLRFSVAVPSQNLPSGVEVPFDINIYNLGNTTRNITVKYAWDHDSAKILGTALVPAQDSATLTYYTSRGGRFRTWFYDENGIGLGGVQRGVSRYSPSISVKTSTDKREYGDGEENVSISLDIKNLRSLDTGPSDFTVRVLNPLNTLIFTEGFNLSLAPYESTAKTLAFNLSESPMPGTYLISIETFNPAEGRSQYSYGYFVVPKKHLSITKISMPGTLLPGENASISFVINNTGIRNVYNATFSPVFKDPNDQFLWQGEVKNFGLLINESTAYNYEIPIPSANDFGDYSLEYTLDVDQEKLIGNKKIILSSEIIKVDFDKSSYKVRENITIGLSLVNNGKFLHDLTMAIEAPDIGFTDLRNFSLHPNQQGNVSYLLTIPGTVESGQHETTVTLSLNNTINSTFSFFIPESKLVQSLEDTSYSGGENITVTLENVGGVDTN